jgi:cell division transport system permease protein
VSARDKPERWRPAPLLPADPAQDAALVFVTAVLCFLACLAVLGALGADRAARGWNADLRGSATVLVRPSGGDSADAAANRAAETLAGVRGVSEARAVQREKAEALVRPWLGEGADLADLPVPRIVAVELDHVRPASAADLRRALEQSGLDAVVDDHSRWTRQIVRGAEVARAGAIAAAALVLLAAAAVIVFATRAGLAARAEVVEVLHLTGAEDRLIAGLFQWRFARLVLVAGVFAALAAALLAALFKLTTDSGGRALAPVAWTDLATLPACPILAAAVAAIAARFTALARLRGIG